MVKKGILLVSFGTAAAEAWEKTLGLLAGEVRESFPDVPVYEAITSPTIREEEEEEEEEGRQQLEL